MSRVARTIHALPPAGPSKCCYQKTSRKRHAKVLPSNAENTSSIPGSIRPVVPRRGSQCLFSVWSAGRANQSCLHLLVSERGPLPVWGSALQTDIIWLHAAVQCWRGNTGCLLRAHIRLL